MGRIIRAERRGPALIRAEAYAAQSDASLQLEAARADASRIRAEAEEEVAQLRERAVIAAQAIREQAELQGHADGVARAARELFDVAALRTRTLQAAERDVQQAVLMLASKLAQQHLELAPGALAALVTPLFTRIRRARRITLRVHPEDSRALAELRLPAEVKAELHVVEDPAIARGGCLIQSDVGELDARLESRVAELARALRWEAP